MAFVNDENTGGIQQFDFSVNLLRAILWQYNNAPNLIGILQAKQEWYDTNQTEFWEDWHTNVFNLNTANDFGLSVWSQILQIPLYNNITPPTGGDVFGFDSQTGFNFDNGYFGNAPSGETYNLPKEIKRIALKLRYFQLTSAGTVPEVNRMLKFIFGEMGTAYLVDYHNMSQVYVFNFAVNYELAYLLNNFDILPRPAGVSSGWIDATNIYFGFATGDFNFDNGIFFGG